MTLKTWQRWDLTSVRINSIKSGVKCFEIQSIQPEERMGHGMTQATNQAGEHAGSKPSSGDG